MNLLKSMNLSNGVECIKKKMYVKNVKRPKFNILMPIRLE